MGIDFELNIDLSAEDHGQVEDQDLVDSVMSSCNFDLVEQEVMPIERGRPPFVVRRYDAAGIDCAVSRARDLTKSLLETRYQITPTITMLIRLYTGEDYFAGFDRMTLLVRTILRHFRGDAILCLDTTPVLLRKKGAIKINNTDPWWMSKVSSLVPISDTEWELGPIPSY